MAKTPAVPKAAPQPPKQEVMAPVQTAVGSSTPDFMKGYEGQGTENIGQGDVETPRIKLLQALSPELELFEEAKAGEFWHTIAQVSLGKKLRIVPVYIDMRAILWNPRESGGGILARSDDLVHWNPPHGEFAVKVNKGTKAVTWKLHPLVSTSRLLEWGSSDPDDSGSQPAATKMYNIVVASPDHPDLGPAVITLQRSSVRVAKKFLGQLKLVRAPSFGCRFEMSSVDEKNSNSQGFKNFQFNALGMVDNEAEFMHYKSYYDSFKAIGLQIKDIDGLADEDPAAAATDDKDAPAY